VDVLPIFGILLSVVAARLAGNAPGHRSVSPAFRLTWAYARLS